LLYNKDQIITALKTVATALGVLKDRVMFVGGAVVPLYVSNEAAPHIRPTVDVDLVFEIASEFELEIIRQSLAARKICAAMDQQVICRFRFKDILIDVMSTEAVGWAPANPWFKLGFKNAIPNELDDHVIQLMPVAHFLASKFTAFNNKGEDPRINHDFEDIIYIIDNRDAIVHDILSAESKVGDFLKNQSSRILSDRSFQEAVRGHLEPATQEERYQMFVNKLNSLLKCRQLNLFITDHISNKNIRQRMHNPHQHKYRDVAEKFNHHPGD